MKTARDFGADVSRAPLQRAELIAGPFSKHERENALSMRKLSLTDGYIAEQLNRSVKSVAAFFGAYDRHNEGAASAALAARVISVKTSAQMPELAAAFVEERDMEIVATLWIKLHRPEPARPKMLQPA
jgi:hypothetical protein